MPQDVYAVSVAATKVQLPSETHSDNPPPTPLSTFKYIVKLWAYYN